MENSLKYISPYDAEIWIDIPDFSGYQASNYGRFRNTKRDKILKLNIAERGYFHVNLSREGKPHTFRSHRVTASIFCENPENKPEVNHRNGIKSCNYWWNLEWNTRSENNRHAIDTGLLVPPKGEKHGHFGKCRGAAVRARVVLDLAYGIFYDCLKDAAEAKNVTYSQAKNRMRGITFNNLDLIYV